MHADALVSYERGSALDPSDEHLAGQCVAARTRHAEAASAERRHVAVGAVIGLIAVLLIVFSSSDGGTASRVAATFFGGFLGGVGGVAPQGHLRGRAVPTVQTQVRNPWPYQIRVSQ